jgi:hypothetical protein
MILDIAGSIITYTLIFLFCFFLISDIYWYFKGKQLEKSRKKYKQFN